MNTRPNTFTTIVLSVALTCNAFWAWQSFAPWSKERQGMLMAQELPMGKALATR